MEEQLEVFLRTHPWLWLGAIAFVGMWAWSMTRYVVQTGIATVVVVALFWLLAPGGRPIVEAARAQPTWGARAACVLQSVIRVSPVTREDRVKRVPECRTPTPAPAAPAPPGPVEKQAAAQLDALLDRRRLAQ